MIKPSMRVQKITTVEGEKDSNGSLVVPHVYDLIVGPNEASADPKLPAPGDDRMESVAKGAATPCLEELMENFSHRWGGGRSIFTDRQGMRC